MGSKINTPARKPTYPLKTNWLEDDVFLLETFPFFGGHVNFRGITGKNTDPFDW